MSDKKKSPDEQIKIAVEGLRTSVKSTQQSVRWQHEVLGDIASLRAMVREYREAMTEDRECFEQGEWMHKDQPNINRFKNIPKRPRGFVDTAHSAEYQIGQYFTKLIERVDSTEWAQEDRYDYLHHLGALAKALDDVGIYLDQRKAMGSPGTMPQDPDQPKSNRKDMHTVFRRLYKMQDDERNR